VSEELQGRRALVTGGSRGIGACIGRALAREGAEVVLAYRSDDESAAATQAAIVAAGGKASLRRANLARPEEIKTLFADMGPLDVMVHAAALGSFKPTMEVRANQFDLTVSVGARAFLQCVQLAAPLMKEGGRIIAVSSLGSTRVVPSYGVLGVAKASLEALVRYLAVEMAPRGIRVNAVSAGLVAATSVGHHPEYDRLLRDAEARTPLGRLMRPDELAEAVLLLCSRRADWIVGQTIVADGGVSLWL
jgi:enoyl-[acyl-carrier protein] reductase III